jgi:hypothetical protein
MVSSIRKGCVSMLKQTVSQTLQLNWQMTEEFQAQKPQREGGVSPQSSIFLPATRM